MAKKIKVSVIIPVYNVAPYIVACIESVMSQTWQENLECILVDDCGTDDSFPLVKKRLKDYDGRIDFRIIKHRQNRGLSAARNTGMEAMTGDYVYFLDSDDELTPDCIECLVKPLFLQDYDFVVGDYRLVGGTQRMDPLRLKDGETLKDDEVLRSYRKKDWYIMSVNKLYRTSFLNQYKLRFYEGIIHEDELWSFQIACVAKSVYAVAHNTYIYKVRENSITTTPKNSERRCTSINIILKEMCNYAQARGLNRNLDVHNLIQSFQMITLNAIYFEAPSLFRGFYERQRREMGRTWLMCAAMNGTCVRKQLRDLHLLLPITLAIPYLKLIFHFM